MNWEERFLPNVDLRQCDFFAHVHAENKACVMRIMVGASRNVFWLSTFRGSCLLLLRHLRALQVEEGRQMFAMHHFRLELRNATMPTYVASYLFPCLLLVYEMHRVGRWIFDNGLHFANYKFMGYEVLLMLAFVALQVIVETVFLFGARLGRHHDFEHRIANVVAGVGCSVGILLFDLALQYAV